MVIKQHGTTAAYYRGLRLRAWGQGYSKYFGKMSNKKALLFIVIAGAVVYYFLIHRRRK